MGSRRSPCSARKRNASWRSAIASENDLDAAWRLVMSHLRFVAHIARGYNGYGLAQADLIQEGNIGLMKAVKRFDPTVGVRLVSFAVHWVRAEIHEFILRNWRIVKVATTKSQRKLFFNLRSAKKRLGWMNQEEVNQSRKGPRVSVPRTCWRWRNASTRMTPRLMPSPTRDRGERAPAPAAYSGRHAFRARASQRASRVGSTQPGAAWQRARGLGRPQPRDHPAALAGRGEIHLARARGAVRCVRRAHTPARAGRAKKAAGRHRG